MSGLDSFFGYKRRFFLNAGKFLQFAVEIARADSGSARDYTSSILFAHTAAEAFVNELQPITELYSEQEDAPEFFESFSKMLANAEDMRASIEFKYQIATFITSGKSLDKGKQPYQDFDILIKLRNVVVHGKAGDVVSVAKVGQGMKISKPEYLRNLQQRGLLAELSTHFVSGATTELTLVSNFLEVIGVQEMAKWACRTSANMIKALIESFPDYGEPPIKGWLRDRYAELNSLEKL